jgi:hypothetical protein
MALPGLTVLNHYRLLGPAGDFVAAISALSRRVEAEGHPGIRGYRFFVSDTGPGLGRARAVIDYVDAAAWIGHHDLAMGWPEMKALHLAARLEDVVFLGPVAPQIHAWLANASLTARLEEGYSLAAGFERP